MVKAFQERMDVSRWWRKFLTTFDRNQDRKCDKSLTLKASWIRNLFHQDSRWMENSTAKFWVDWGKTSGANVETNGETTSGPSIITTLRLTRRSLCNSFWLLWTRQSSPLSLLTGPRHLWFFHILEDEIETQEATFWQHWRTPDRIAERDEDADAKWLPEVLSIMEIPLESLYPYQRGLLRRGRGRVEISVRG